jgi:hypothetical protein
MALSDLHLVVNPTGLPEAVCLAARRRRRAALSRVDLSGGCGSRCPATTIRSRARRACRKAPRHAPAGDRGETRARPVGLMADAEWRANPSDPAEPRRSRTGDRTAGRHGRSTSPSPIARSRRATRHTIATARQSAAAARTATAHNVSRHNRHSAGSGGGVTGTSLPVQSYLVTTPLVYPTPLNSPDAPSLVSLTLRFDDGLHNLLPGHMAAALQEELEGWVRTATASRDQVLDLLAMVGPELHWPLREAIIVALDHRAAALQFSEPRSFRVRDLLTLATAVTAYSALGSDALVVVALAGSCFVLLQVFLGLATVTNYGVTQIGTVLVDRVVEKLRGGAPPPG